MTDQTLDDVNGWLEQQKACLEALLEVARAPGSDRQQVFQQLLDLSNRLLDLSKRSLEVGSLASQAAASVMTQIGPPLS